MQGFQIPAPQYTDPLQTLAQMGQLRTQGLQQQTAQMGLDKARMELNSQKAMMDAMVQSGGDYKKFFELAARHPDILPGDLIAAQEHHTKMMQDAATLDKTTNENISSGIDRYRGLLSGVQTPDDLAAANATADQLGIHPKVPRLTQFTDPAHVTAYSNSLATQAQALAEAKEKAATEASKATATKEGVLTTEAQQKVDAGEKAQVAQELQAAPVDPQTGTPTPAAVAAIQARHPKVILSPDISTKEGLNRFVRSLVPGEKQPEFDINTMKAQLGLMGNSEFDQFMLKHAQGLGTTPAKLTPEQFNAGLQKYATLKQDPTLLALILGQKGLQNQMTQAQLSSIPGKDDIELMARQMVNGDLSLDDIRNFKTRYGNAATQAYRRADEIVRAEGNPLFPGKPFSPANLETALDTRAKTEEKFTTGPEAQMIRSFDNLMQHTGLLDEARKALGSGDLPALRRIANAFGVQAGDTAQTTYDTIADFVAAEAGKAFLPAGGGEAERAKNYSHFERGLGDQQISKNIKALMHLADSQREGLENQYKRGTFGKGLQTGQLFSQQALATRDRLMGSKPAGTGSAPLVIRVGNKRYQYKGAGAKSDLNNYTEIPNQ